LHVRHLSEATFAPMPVRVQIRVSPATAANPAEYLPLLKAEAGLKGDPGARPILRKRSIDARQRTVFINLTGDVYAREEDIPEYSFRQPYQQVKDAPEVFIIGAGPAGLFAALRLLEEGLKPVILERGKNVKERRRDLAKLTKEHVVNPDSNYCFGEGGAGTYSDGKLYTRSTKRGDVDRILYIFTEHGADEDILIDAHPHIGTNKLPGIIESMRQTIIAHGGEVRFGCRVTDIVIENDRVTALEINDSEKVICNRVLLATGHSASDIYYLLHEKGLELEAKEFALGVRVEHPQRVIDAIQYHCETRDENLPPASYNLVEQVRGKGVYSFCMCPGGIIAPCATGPEEIVTNGWSPSKRNNPFANSGMVVTVDALTRNAFESHGPLAGLKYREFVERTCWEAGGRTQAAPAQRLTDFVAGRASDSLPDCSYIPGVVAARVDLLLPPDVTLRLREGFIAFGKKMRGFLHPDAIVVAPESRTSAPVRIPRDDSGQHIRVRGLYPCGEGAGYAGGIVSAGIDGERMAVKIAESAQKTK